MRWRSSHPAITNSHVPSNYHDIVMSAKQAACLNCRRSKIKCRRDEDASTCERCLNVGSECVIPEFHIGRQKGVKK